MSISYGGDYITDTDGGKLRPSSAVMRNRIINGAMVIDQRNAGASVNLTADGQYTLDRWTFNISQNSKLSVQQSTTAPVGFTNSLKATSLSAYSITSGDYFVLEQRIEGYNIADLGFGTANAKTITLSFWVQSSLTGTFSGSISNGYFNRAYPFNYTISSANTWTQISVTISGDTAGSWRTDNGGGMVVQFNLGTGSTYTGTVNTWNTGGWFTGTAGSVSLVGTNAATWYVTGVQLEVGSSATGYEYRQYGTEFQLCQRYYQVVSNGVVCCCESGTTSVLGSVIFPTCMRTLPSVSPSAAMRISDIAYSGFVQSSAAASIGSGNSGDAVRVRMPNFTGLTTARWYMQTNDSSAGVLQFSAEL